MLVRLDKVLEKCYIKNVLGWANQLEKARSARGKRVGNQRDREGGKGRGSWGGHPRFFYVLVLGSVPGFSSLISATKGKLRYSS